MHKPPLAAHRRAAAARLGRCYNTVVAGPNDAIELVDDPSSRQREADPADGAADADGDGYTNLEAWLNGLVATP